MDDNQNAKGKETKSERFKRIATKRTRKILYDLRLLGNCSNKVVYSYTEDEVKKIFDAIDEELRIAKTLFVNKKGKDFNL